jgi:hypothetical protein
VNSGGAGGEGDVGAGIDEQDGSRFSVMTSRLHDRASRFAGQRFEVAGGEIFLPELDVVDSGVGGLGDFVEETEAASAFVAGEGFAVGDVVEEVAVSHQLSALV